MDQISNNIEELLPYILVVSFAFPLLSLLFLIKKIRIEKSVFTLASYSITFLLLNQFFDELVTLLGKKNYYFFYTFFEYFFFGFLIYFNIKDKSFKPIFLVSNSIFVLLMIISYKFFNIRTLDSISIGIESIFLIIFILFFFYDQLKNISAQSIYEFFGFWIVLGILIYVGFTFFFNILANYLSPKMVNTFSTYTFIGDILRNILFSIALIFSNKMEKKNIPSIPKLDMI